MWRLDPRYHLIVDGARPRREPHNRHRQGAPLLLPKTVCTFCLPFAVACAIRPACALWSARIHAVAHAQRALHSARQRASPSVRAQLQRVPHRPCASPRTGAPTDARALPPTRTHTRPLREHHAAIHRRGEAHNPRTIRSRDLQGFGAPRSTPARSHAFARHATLSLYMRILGTRVLHVAASTTSLLDVGAQAATRIGQRRYVRINAALGRCACRHVGLYADAPGRCVHFDLGTPQLSDPDGDGKRQQPRQRTDIAEPHQGAPRRLDVMRTRATVPGPLARRRLGHWQLRRIPASHLMNWVMSSLQSN
jgi:hypothetical protein